MKTSIIKIQYTTPDGIVLRSAEIEIPNNTSDLINDSGFLTESDLSGIGISRGRSLLTTNIDLSTDGGTIDSSEINTPSDVENIVEGDLILDTKGIVAKVVKVSGEIVTYEYFTTISGGASGEETMPSLSINEKGELVATY